MDINLQLYKVMFDTSSEAMVITDAEARIIDINPAFCKITGYQREEVLGKNPKILNSGIQDRHFYKAMWEQINRQHYWQGELWNKRKNGEIFPIWQTINQVTSDQKVIHYISVFSDISKFKEAEKNLWQLAHFDSLTNLANRNLIEKKLCQELSDITHQQYHCALLFIDLDDFKRINDSLGHKIGDQFLIQVAKRLKQMFRSDDTIGRIGGDEFIVLLNNLSGSHREARDQVTRAVLKLMDSLKPPIEIGPHLLHLSCSIGITLFNDNNKTSDQILKEADTAMYVAKKEGKNNFSFFYDKLQQEANQRLLLEKELYTALKHDHFEVFYQLQFNTNHQIVGCEALVRWRHPERGLISPADFIPIAEQTGLIIQIGEQVLIKACRQLALWQQNTKQLVPHLSVNISPRQFIDKNFTEKVKNIIQYTGINASSLTLEITESLLLHHIQSSSKKIDELRQLGLRFSIDDFGTGYSSLSYLSRLPIDQLKIDRSFISNLEQNPSDRVIVDMIIALAEHLQLDVIAEGVETEDQLNHLKRCGCTCFQGFYFSRPKPAQQLFKDNQTISIEPK